MNTWQAAEDFYYLKSEKCGLRHYKPLRLIMISGKIV